MCLNRFFIAIGSLLLIFPAHAQAPLEITAASAVIMDAETGKVLWSKDPNTPRYPASTTKIMTALLLIERCGPDDVITAPEDVEKVKEASLHLMPGEQLTASEMLYALMLRSANDGCYVVARHIGGSVEKFAQMMNQRAKEIGCTKVNFCNPHGLHNPNHKISANDLAKIAREAMKQEVFRKVVQTQKYQIQRSLNQEDQWLINKNKYLKQDSSADGIKTGWTKPAGKCYVGSATRNGFRVITAILKSEDWVADHKAMLTHAFQNFERRKLFEPTLLTVPVVGGQATNVSAKAQGPIFTVTRKNSKKNVSPVAMLSSEQVAAPVKKGQVLGHIVTKDAEGFEQRVPILASEDVFLMPPTKSKIIDPVWLIGCFVLVGGTYLIRRRSKQSFSSYGGS